MMEIIVKLYMIIWRKYDMKKAVALVSLADQDWKTQLAHGYSNIPVDAVVDVVNEDFTNLYGNWCEVIWNNRHYYVSKKDLSFNEIDIEMAMKNQSDYKQYKEFFK
jgi:hypothetical protein